MPDINPSLPEFNPQYVERFWSRVIIGSPSECWYWTGWLQKDGYGRCTLAKHGWSVHRYAYTLCVGPIPDGYQIDHNCHNLDTSCPGGLGCQHRRCVNPNHLEPVTNKVNAIRAHAKITHCPKGHEYGVPGNTFREKSGGRKCAVCRKIRTAICHSAAREHRNAQRRATYARKKDQSISHPPQRKL